MKRENERKREKEMMEKATLCLDVIKEAFAKSISSRKNWAPIVILIFLDIVYIILK